MDALVKTPFRNVVFYEVSVFRVSVSSDQYSIFYLEIFPQQVLIVCLISNQCTFYI